MGRSDASCHVAIQSFHDSLTETVAQGLRPKGFPADLFKATRRKLAALNAAETLEDLRSPPGNRLHALERDRAGQHAIRINDQFRLCFVWTEAGPERVEFTDYH
ncbi:type II toxin-antitoxin system RelE/ParE family toxin [Methylorubrum populi]|nr:type II toxin-antitoxin system RelE/ParE family toxin [Methylorubrum populi]